MAWCVAWCVWQDSQSRIEKGIWEMKDAVDCLKEALAEITSASETLDNEQRDKCEEIRVSLEDLVQRMETHRSERASTSTDERTKSV